MGMWVCLDGFEKRSKGPLLNPLPTIGTRAGSGISLAVAGRFDLSHILPISVVIIAGGSGPGGSGKMNDIWIYNDVTNTGYTSPVSMQEGRSWHGASAVPFYRYFYDYCL